MSAQWPLHSRTYQVELLGVHARIEIRIYRADAIVEQTEHNETQRKQVGLGRCAFVELTFDGRKVKIWLCDFG